MRPVASAPAPTTPTIQNLRILQGANGQLQVTGLLPGQQILKLPDGRLQLITTPTATAQLQQQQQQQLTPKVQVMQLPTGQIQLKAQTAAPLQPQVEATTQKVVVSTPSGPAIMDAIKTSQGMILTSPGGGPKLVLPASKPTSIPVASTSAAVSKINTLQQITQQQQPRPKVVGTTAGGSVLLQAKPQPTIVRTASGQQFILRPAVAVTTASPSPVTTPVTSVSTTATQQPIQQQLPTELSPTSQAAAAASASPPGISSTSSEPGKYTVTPQVVQQGEFMECAGLCISATGSPFVGATNSCQDVHVSLSL